MSIPDKKKPYLQEIMGEEGVKELENANAQTKQVAEDQNIESKEETPEVVDEKAKTEGKKPCTKKADGTEDCVDEEMVEAKKEETPSAETQPSETKEEPAKVEANLVSAEQLAEVVTAFTKGLNDAVEALNAKIESIRTEVKEAKEKSAVDTTNPVIPTASLAAIIATGLRGVGNEDNRVKKSETLAKSGPEETPANESAQARYGNPVVDSVIRGITGEK